MSSFRVSFKVQFSQELTAPQAEVIVKDQFGNEAELTNLKVRIAKEKKSKADHAKRIEGEISELKTLVTLAKTAEVKSEVQKLLHRKEVRLERIQTSLSTPKAPKAPKAKKAKAEKK